MAADANRDLLFGLLALQKGRYKWRRTPANLFRFSQLHCLKRSVCFLYAFAGFAALR